MANEEISVTIRADMRGKPPHLGIVAALRGTKRLLREAAEEGVAYTRTIELLVEFLGQERETVARRFAAYVSSQPLSWRQCFGRIVANCPDAMAAMRLEVDELEMEDDGQAERPVGDG